MKNLLITIISLIPLMTVAQPCQTAIIKNVEVRDFQAVRSGSMMNVNMTLVLDNLKLRADQQLMLTPVLYNGNDTVALSRLFINGRRQHIQYLRGMDRLVKGGDRVLKRENGKGQTVSYMATTPYQEWMEAYTAAILEDDCGCGNLMEQNATDILTVKPKEPFRPQLAFITPPATPKVFQIEKKARITFVVNKTYLDPTYMQNPSELDSIYRTIQLVKNDPNITITNINLHGTASPESPYTHNTMLASGRANTIKEYVCGMVQLPNSVFTSSYTPENWAELIQYIEQSELSHKSEILALCNDESIEPDAREARIKKLYPAEYKYMYGNWYPDLRRTTYRVQYEVREFTVEEAKALIKTKPQQLSLNELYLVAQTYAPGSAEFNEVMEIAVRLHPDDSYANLNAACTRLAAEDYDGARRYISKMGDSPQALNAKGVMAWHDNNPAEAEILFQEAVNAGLATATENLKQLKENIANP